MASQDHQAKTGSKPWLLITGAGSGMGRATALAAAERFGFHLVLCGRQGATLTETARQARELNPAAQTVTQAVDLTDENSIQLAAERIQEAQVSNGGRLQGIIHFAGRGNPVSSILSDTSGELELCLATNVTGPLQLTRLLLADLRAGPGSFLVFVGAGMDKMVQPGTGPYGISKMALKRLFLQMIEDMAHQPQMNDPVVSLLQPGVVDTGGLRQHVAQSEALSLPHASYLSQRLDAGESLSAVTVAERLLSALTRHPIDLHGREVRASELLVAEET